MDKKKTKILISVVLLIAAVGVAYFLSYSSWKESNNIDSQISQTKTSIATSESYYADIDAKVKALNDAGWATKKASILINFDKSLWFTSKINNFFKAIVPMGGMKLVSMTSSSSGSGGR
jgi:prefoldin subunit 5